MYQVIDDTLVMTVSDWVAAGLSMDAFWHDSCDGLLKIYRRGINGNTLIDVRSIRRPERRAVLEAAYGPIGGVERATLYRAEVSAEARAYYVAYRTADGGPLGMELIAKYVNRASLLESLKRGLEVQRGERAKSGKRLVMGQWYETAMGWYNEHACGDMPCAEVRNVRSFERVFKAFLKDGYASVISGNVGNDNSRKVSVRTEGLLLALWRTNDKPFVHRVWELYNEFCAGSRDLYDRETGEVYKPEDFRYKGRTIEISEGTVWNYLKDVMNYTAVYADRNGNFAYQNALRPKHVRKLGQYSLSKISMDDVALSRQSVKGWVYKYIAVDVLSGYYFHPAYVVGKPNASTVLDSMRNVFCELEELGLPIPGELEVEHHLMENVEWLGEVFPFVRFCASATEKRAEHNIRQLKYGTAKDAGHTLGRWYAKSEAYRSVRTKVAGDYEIAGSGKGVGGLTPESIAADDLRDIEAHNSELHPNQKRFPGMTRRDVLVKMANPELRGIEQWFLWRYIGNMTSTSITNNNYVTVKGEKFELKDFGCIANLKANTKKVEAYWLEGAEGRIERCYLYQGDVYIGEAENMECWRYNEFACERGAEDEAKMLHQMKRVAKFDRMVKERRADIPRVGQQQVAVEERAWSDVEVEEIEVHEQPVGYEGDEFGGDIDYGRLAKESL